MDTLKDLYFLYKVFMDLKTKIIPWWKKNWTTVLVGLIGIVMYLGSPLRSQEKNNQLGFIFLAMLVLACLHRSIKHKQICIS